MSVEEALNLISNRTLSASQIAEALVALSSHLPRKELHLLAGKAFGLRPAMPILGNVLMLVYELGPDRVMNLLKEATKRAVSNALERFGSTNSAITISNSSLVREFLLKARPKKVVALKSEPGGEGVDLVKLLRRNGIDATVAEDSACYYACSKVELVLTGADALYEDGFLNKVGTRLLALCAKELDKEFLVLSTTLKFDPRGRHLEDYYEEVEGAPLFEFVPKDDLLLCMEDGVGGWRYGRPYSKKSVI